MTFWGKGKQDEREREEGEGRREGNREKTNRMMVHAAHCADSLQSSAFLVATLRQSIKGLICPLHFSRSSNREQPLAEQQHLWHAPNTLARTGKPPKRLSRSDNIPPYLMHFWSGKLLHMGTPYKWECSAYITGESRTLDTLNAALLPAMWGRATL